MVAISTRASLFFYFVAVNSLFFRICYRFPKVFIFTLKTKNVKFYLRCELELSSFRCRFSLVATTTQTLSDLRSMQIPLKNHSLRRSIDRNNLRPSFLFFIYFRFCYVPLNGSLSRNFPFFSSATNTQFSFPVSKSTKT